MTPSLLGRLAAAGVLSTLTMDLLATAVRKAGLTAGMPPDLFGRWFGWLFRGRLVHHTIADSPDVGGGMPLAMACHYAIGISLTAVFWLALQKTPLKEAPASTLVGAAIVFALFTNLLPWLLMFPSMGFGVFGKDGPPEFLLLRTSFVNHVAFGVGLAWTALALKAVRA
jgi:hypothetical protein